MKRQKIKTGSHNSYLKIYEAHIWSLKHPSFNTFRSDRYQPGANCRLFAHLLLISRSITVGLLQVLLNY